MLMHDEESKTDYVMDRLAVDLEFKELLRSKLNATAIIEIIMEIIFTTITTAKSSPTESPLSSQMKSIPIAFEEELGLH
jgi:hypothetical protein